MDNAALNRLVTIALFVLLPFAVYHARHAIWPRKVDPPPPAEYLRIIERFQHRRRIFRVTLTIVFAAFAVVLALPLLSRSSGGRNATVPVVEMGIAFGVMAVAIGIGSVVYRCPWCGSPPWARIQGGKGVSLAPAVCPTCGAPLK